MIKTDVDGRPIPQYYNPSTDNYEPLHGANGAARHVIYGPDGNPITTTGNKLAVRATEIETQLTTIQGYIDGLEGAIGQAVASPAANTILARLKSLEDKIDAITDGTSPAVTQLSGSMLTLKDYTDATVRAATFYWYLTGENRKGYTDISFQPYDVSKYKTKYVYYQNNTVAERKIKIYGFASSAIIPGGILTDTAVFSSTILTVAAGASLLMTPSTIPELGIPITGLAVQTVGSPTEAGTETIRIFGGVL